MGAERLDRVIVTRELCLSERRVDLLMTEVVEEHLGPRSAAFKLGDQVMDALRDLRRDRSLAERAAWWLVILLNHS